jgi:hypothetical protein
VDEVRDFLYQLRDEGILRLVAVDDNGEETWQIAGPGAEAKLDQLIAAYSDLSKEF